ncbi:ligand-binding sensor domain-containing protein [Flavilitoribacter nigricans]|uniref:Histidine kinase n=1 Tax=Flavilitoribacter nigricans (strain ATCC 23147 / DSM 23189 / NBRC 102662 / NCIMB 1420 / SS-2) TaxID=1122177 RepID=A0A2D0N108_FLAN2|nr:sensor histidine kinase [Flavilitoribacter nigricans]PHN02147.1 hypothetical protein CRP01_33705 [Flavilitoribacter nigricans DSM 23189 = NBRC 102662]
MNILPGQFRLKMQGVWVLPAILLFSIAPLLGQTGAVQPILRFESLTTVEGLPNNSTNAVVQDSAGFLWIATWEGLARYDGYEVRAYRTDPGDSTTLTNNRIECLLVDRSGRLWVGTWDGINRYHPDRDAFERIRFVNGADDQKLLGQVNAMAEDSRGDLWVGTQAGDLFRFDPVSNQFERFLGSEAGSHSLLNEEVRVILGDREGNVWIGTGEPFNPTITGAGLFKLHPETGEVKTYRHDLNDAQSLIDDRVSALHEDEQGMIWIGTCQSGLHRLDPSTDNMMRLPSAELSIRAPIGDPGPWSACPPVTLIGEDRQGGLWIGTYNGGLHRYDLSTGALQAYANDPTDEESLATDEVWSFFIDRSGILWIASHASGLQKVNPFAKKFRTFREDPDGLSHSFISGISSFDETPELLWVGTQQGGLNRIDLRSGEVASWLHQPADPGSLNGNTIWAVRHDSKGQLWVGTDQGMDLTGPVVESFRHFMEQMGSSGSFRGNTVLTIYEDRQGYLWVGSWDSNLYRFDPKTGKYQAFDYAGEITASDSRIHHIFEDEDGMLWLSTYLDALYRFDPASGESIPFLKGIGSNWVHPAADGHFWVGTNDRGLIRFHPETGAMVEAFTHAEGLPSNTVFAILEDAAGWLWISTGNGLAHFNPETGQFINYDASDGLPGNSFNIGSAFQDARGRMFFGGPRGVVLVNPGQMVQNLTPPRVALTGLKILRRGEPEQLEKLPPGWEPEQEIKLGYNENDLTFEFVGLHFGDPSQNLYRYRLDPYDEAWVYAGSRHEARYTSLRPGEYTFRVSAANCDGVWNEAGKFVQIKIQPPWWSTWWFRTLMILVLGLAAYNIYRYRVNQIRREAKTRVAFERKLADEKLSALKAQMNPHFLFNCLNSIDHYIIKNDIAKASEYLGNFSQLMRLTLQNSRVSFVPLNEELEALRLYLEMENLRFNGNFDYEIRLDDQIDPEGIEIPPMMIQPFVENSIWHGLMHKKQGGKLSITIRQQGAYLSCLVEDNGVGRARARELEAHRSSKRRSFGMRITEDRIRMINELYNAGANVEITDLYDQDGEAAGTRVVLNLPL